MRWALPAPPVVTAFYRVAFATAVLGGALLLRRGPAAPRSALPGLIAAGVCFGADMALWHTSLVQTSVANATLLVNTTPLWVGAWALAGGAEPLGARLVGGAGLALLGAAVLLGSDWADGASVRGDGLALAAGLFYAGYLLWMKQLRRGVDAAPAVAVAGVAAAATLALTAWLRGDPFTGFPAHSWWAFAGAACISHLGGVLGIVWALRDLRATFASVALLAQPVGTAALGWWLLGEPLSPLQALGGAAVLLGIFLASASAAEPRAAGARPTASGRAG